jgi:hypothetical protein
MFRMHLTYNDLVVYDTGEMQPDTDKIKKIKTLACENFEDSVSEHYIRNNVNGGTYIYRMGTEELIHTCPVVVKYDKATFGDAKWLKCSGLFMCPEWPAYFKHLLVLDVMHGNDVIKHKQCRIEPAIGIADNSCEHKVFTLDHLEIGRWGPVYYFVKIPADIQDGDEIKVYIWNICKKPMNIDNICLDLYK